MKEVMYRENGKTLVVYLQLVWQIAEHILRRKIK